MSTHRLIFIGVLIFFCALIYPMLDVLWVTRDDTHYNVSTFNQVVLGSAFAQQRIHYFIGGQLVLIPYWFDSFIWYKFCWALSIGLLGYTTYNVLNLLVANRVQAMMYVLLLLTLWQNSWGHNALISNVFTQLIFFSLFAQSVGWLIQWVRSSFTNNKYLIGSLIAWYIALNSVELYYMFFSIMLLLMFHHSKAGDFKTKLRDAFFWCRWHFLVLLLSFTAYLLFRTYCCTHVDSGYVGVKISSDIDLSAILQVLVTFSLGLFPGIQFFVKGIYGQLPSFFNMTYFLLTCLLGIFLVRVRPTMGEISFDRSNLHKGMLVAVLLIFMPNALVALTKNYQHWVVNVGTIDYIYSTLSYFGIILVFWLFLMLLANSKYLYGMFVAGIMVLYYFTSLNNVAIAQDQAAISQKWRLVHAVMQNSELLKQVQPRRICAPNLQQPRGIMHTYEGYWTHYLTKKMGQPFEVIEKHDSRCNVNLEYATSNRGSLQYLVVRNRAGDTELFLTKDECLKYPCSVSYEHDGFTSIMKASQVQSSGRLVKDLGKGMPLGHGIEYYSLGKTRGMVIVQSEFPRSILSVNFSKGFHGVESDGSKTWQWAQDRAEFRLEVDQPYRFALRIGVGMAQSGAISFMGPSIKETRLADASSPVAQRCFMVDLAPGSQVFELSTELPAVQLNPSDPRKMAFMLTDLSIGTTCAVN